MEARLGYEGSLFSLDEEPVEVSVVPAPVPQVAVVGEDLNLIALGKLQDHRLSQHAFSSSQNW